MHASLGRQVARSARRSARPGAAPAAIAASTVCGSLRRPGRRRRRAGARASMPSGVTPPPTAMHRTPAAAARRATPSAVLPNAVCSSIRPSPVTTRSARASFASKPVASITSSTPGPQGERPEPVLDGRAARSRRRPPRRRPASRARAARSHASSSSAYSLRRASSSTTCSGVAPFCGPVGRGRAGRSQERVRDVAGDDRRRARLEALVVLVGRARARRACPVRRRSSPIRRSR